MAEENIEEGQEEEGGKKVKARTCSLIAKVIGALYILIVSTLSFLGIFNAPIKDICLIGFAIMGIFGTVDLNLLVEKFTHTGD